jgi:UDP-N-acetylmuramoyl-L-alanyl-D-glutamate--2,6-diaminopimelate ligase
MIDATPQAYLPRGALLETQAAVNLSQLLAMAGVVCAPEIAADLQITGLALDSRSVQPGNVFCALAGSQSHGLKYVNQAIANGAIAVLFEPSAGVNQEAGVGSIPYYAVDALGEKISAIASHYFFAGRAAPSVIGVTGTNGKTSTVQLLAQLLAVLESRCGTIGTLGVGFPFELVEGERTTPDAIQVQKTLAELQQLGAEHIAMEVSSHALDQHRVAAIKFRVAMFTNLTRDHLDYHADMESYFKAKASLFAMHGLPVAIINTDDRYGARLYQELQQSNPQLRLLSVGTHQDAMLSASQIELSKAGIAFHLHLGQAQLRFHAPLVGRFNVLNLLGVIAAAIELGYPIDAIAVACAKLKPVDGRMNLLGGDAQPLVVVDYAHTPDALEQALHNVREHTHGKLICVFGCGGDRDTGKRATMGEIAARLADVVWITSDNPRSEQPSDIVQQIYSGVDQSAKPRATQIHVEIDRGKAIAQAIQTAANDDVILIAGKGHENYQEIGAVKLPFDDRLQASLALAARQ